MKYLKIYLIALLALTLFACGDRDEIFEREQYKHVIALLSEGDFNIFAEEHDPSEADGEGFTNGYIAASCGGSLETTLPITLNMVEDADLLGDYNNVNFATEAYKYALYLPSDRYRIENPVISMQPGERSGRMKIRIRAAGLSPDSVYFIPLRVDKCSAYELNPEKSTVLYRVYVKNFWASTKTIPVYSHRGIKLENGTESPVNTMMTKQMVPVSGNEVRIFAGNRIVTTVTPSVIEKWAMRLTIDDNGHVTITPWSDTYFGLKVTQVDGDPEYPNVVRLVDDGYGKTFKTFLLCYDYVDSDDGVSKFRMKEELKIENVVTVK
ncbi:MAG: DUF4361 domain-containing protein [Dysgonamonadaceae bacterium]|jgi:hypothetical protein|nr:DUF4361 domain-containing protein [Dysgonamonadaceae bacterium]